MYKNIWFKLLLAFFPFVLIAQPAELQKAERAVYGIERP